MKQVVIGHFELFELVVLFFAKIRSAIPENKFCDTHCLLLSS